MQLTPTQIPVDNRTKQLTVVVQTLFSASTKKNGKKAVWPCENSYQCPEYECDTNSHKKRHVVINVAAWLVPRVNTRVRGTRSY